MDLSDFSGSVAIVTAVRFVSVLRLSQPAKKHKTAAASNSAGISFLFISYTSRLYGYLYIIIVVIYGIVK